MASRLASSILSPAVLLIEAGKAKDASNSDILAERWTAISQFPRSIEHHTTEAQKWLHNRSVNYDRGKVLGGSSAINMCAYTIGPRDDYNRWAELVGDASFGWENATRIRREKLEAFGGVIPKEYASYASPDMSIHGSYGALAVTTPQVWEQPMIIQLDAAKSSGLGLSLDINSGNPLGLASVPSTAKDGLRVTAAKAYLDNAPSNLTILTEKQVVKVLLEGQKAIGIQVESGEKCTSSPQRAKINDY